MGIFTRGKDFNTLAPVRKGAHFITHVGSTDSNNLFSGSGGKITSVQVVVAGSDSEVQARVDGPIDGPVHSYGFTAAQ